MSIIVILIVIIYNISFIGVCNLFNERDVAPSILAFIILFLPIINTLYFIIYVDFSGENDNIHKIFNRNIKKK